MNRVQIAGRCLQLKGILRQKWGKLTKNDVEVIAGSKDEFLGLIQMRYGIVRENVRRHIDKSPKAAP